MNKTTKIILLVAIVVIVMLCVGFCTVIGRLLDKDPDTTPTDTSQGLLPPDYPPTETDPNQESVSGDATVPSSSSGGSISISYTPTVIVDLSDKTVSFTYTNTQSNQNAVAMLEIDGVLIAESATINPGNKISKMTLNDEAAEKLQLGGYDGYLVVGLYNMETGEKSMVDLRFVVEVKVQE